MSKTIKFYYDFLSPYSYLASTQLPALAERVGTSIEYKPIHVLQLMEKVGNQPTTVLCEAKLNYAFADLGRWSAMYNVPIAPNPHLKSIDVTPLLLGALAADDAGLIREYTTTVFAAYWTQQAEFRDSAELLKILKDASIPEPEEIIEQSTNLTDRLEANIAEAVEDGVFGVPSFVSDHTLFFGNDRLSFLEDELSST